MYLLSIRCDCCGHHSGQCRRVPCPFSSLLHRTVSISLIWLLSSSLLIRTDFISSASLYHPLWRLWEWRWKESCYLLFWGPLSPMCTRKERSHWLYSDHESCRNQLHSHACKREGSIERGRDIKTLRTQSLSELSSEHCGLRGMVRGQQIQKKESAVAQSCRTLCDPMDCSPPGSSVHGIFQARVLEWVPSPEDLPNPGIEPGFAALQAEALPSEPQWN